jgi:hypothetical protein
MWLKLHEMWSKFEIVWFYWFYWSLVWIIHWGVSHIIFRDSLLKQKAKKKLFWTWIRETELLFLGVTHPLPPSSSESSPSSSDRRLVAHRTHAAQEFNHGLVMSSKPLQDNQIFEVTETELKLEQIVVKRLLNGPIYVANEACLILNSFWCKECCPFRDRAAA